MTIPKFNSYQYKKEINNYPITWILLLLNLILWILMEINGGSQNPMTLIKFGAKEGILITGGEYWRLLTPIFLHIGFYHLLTNSIGLFIFGRYAETLFGKKSYLTIYIFSGIWGNIASYFYSFALGAGASGALFGIIAAYASYLISNRESLGEYGRQTLTGIILLIFINLIFGFTIDGVDNFAHAGGLFSGLIIGWILSPKITSEIVSISSEIPTFVEKKKSIPKSQSTWYVLIIITIILFYVSINWISQNFYIRLLTN
ncbi:MAG: rhomboid family intramembrane serine protease [Chloroflexi bacterium]|nr:rhomboid family intramembrane serine protease [Chloroflexota bacterium]|tara:strand:+ start:162 stop:938 length:777 start_codon:yes stop_codon:yes gene_type:complete